MGLYIYSWVCISALLILFIYMTYKLFNYEPSVCISISLHNKREDITQKRLVVVKKILGKDKTLDDLALIAMGCCTRHEADMQILWFSMDGTERGLVRWLEETSHCCRQISIVKEKLR